MALIEKQIYEKAANQELTEYLAFWIIPFSIYFTMYRSSYK